jgi:hypothetical protein
VLTCAKVPYNNLLTEGSSSTVITLPRSRWRRLMSEPAIWLVVRCNLAYVTLSLFNPRLRGQQP